MFTQFDWPDEDYSQNSIPFSMNGAHLDVCPVNNPGYASCSGRDGRFLLVTYHPSD
jgi:hypothetical protein